MYVVDQKLLDVIVVRIIDQTIKRIGNHTLSTLHVRPYITVTNDYASQL